MWKARLPLILGVIGAVAGALSPLANKPSDGSALVVADVVGGVVFGGGIWALIGFGVGALIDKVKRGRSPQAAYAPAVGGAPVQQIVPGEAGWFADPFRRFEGRYWDGDGWTNHVATKGKPYLDDPTA